LKRAPCSLGIVIAPEYAGDVVFRKRFDREARLAARIDHPARAAGVRGVRGGGGTVHLDAARRRGTLRRWLRRTVGLRPSWRRRSSRTWGALDAAHELGLVHRDVKPANVLVEREQDGSAHAWLTDFGLAKAVGSKSGLTRTSVWAGTVDYAAPEQLEGGAVDARADVYALGCVLFEPLPGHVPFPRDREVSKIMAHVTEPSPAVTTAVAAPRRGSTRIVRRAMANDPAERFATTGELGAAALAAAGVSGPVALEGWFRPARAVDPRAPTV
jgi:serine/threonine protein kinase